jgi:pimeloyl-ACP methyl ester carboxylesterase
MRTLINSTLASNSIMRAVITSITMLATTTGLAQKSASRSEMQNLIRPFKYHASEAALEYLRQRIKATRWPEKETVNDRSQGVQLKQIRELVNYWATDYNWRKTEAKLNELHHIDGLDINFIHVRSKNRHVLPIIITHGWPGSVFELLKAIGPLTDPEAYGGRAEDAFDVVIPSMPGYGFSAKPNGTGWNPNHIARAWDVFG